MSKTVSTKAYPRFARNKIWKCAWVLISTIYIGLGLLVCHLQTHPSQTQMPFSMRKGNLPKGSFPDNLGHGSSIAIPLAVNQKVGGLDPPRGATNLSWDGWGVGNSLTSVHKISVSTKRPGGPCCLVLLSFELGTLPWWSLRLGNLKHWRLITKRLTTTMRQQWNKWFICLNEFLAAQCWDVPKILGGIDPFSLKSNLESPPIWHSSLLYPSKLMWMSSF